MKQSSYTKVTSKIQTEAGTSRVVLKVKGLGPVPSLKNHKRSVIQQSGKARPITDPKVKEWMDLLVALFVSQLLSASLNDDGGTQTVASRRYWIASCVPADDCWTQIPEISVKCELCEPGQEGATITIESIP